MELAIRIHVEELPEGLFLATSDELPGLVAQGRTVAEALEIARDVARKLIEARRERGGVPRFQLQRSVATIRSSLLPDGRLSGFRYREIARKLKACGFEFDRQAAGSHEIWFNSKTRRYTTIPNHPGDIASRDPQAGGCQSGYLSERLNGQVS